MLQSAGKATRFATECLSYISHVMRLSSQDIKARFPCEYGMNAYLNQFATLRMLYISFKTSIFCPVSVISPEYSQYRNHFEFRSIVYTCHQQRCTMGSTVYMYVSAASALRSKDVGHWRCYTIPTSYDIAKRPFINGVIFRSTRIG